MFFTRPIHFKMILRAVTQCDNGRIVGNLAASGRRFRLINSLIPIPQAAGFDFRLDWTGFCEKFNDLL